VDKTFTSPESAIADVSEGSSVAIAGFGIRSRFPTSLIVALRDKGVQRLTIVCNSLGGVEEMRGQILAENRQISRLITSFSARPGARSIAEDLIASGEMEVELVPQGILVDRLRAGAAGLAAFYSPVGTGTEVAKDKEVRDFNGRPHVLEHALTVDYALVWAPKGDRMGNLQFHGGSQNFNPSFAKAARVAIAEVEELVDVGEIEPQNVGLPGIFVSRIVESTMSVAAQKMGTRRGHRPSSDSKTYNDKPGLTRAQMAERAAALLPDGSTANLGLGMPTLVSNFTQHRDIMLHAENGILGYGGLVDGDDIDEDIYNAGSQFVSLREGASFFDSVTSFEIARSGKLDAVILGAYQVDAVGNLANWSTPAMTGGGIGGAMDLVVEANKVVILMNHHDGKGGSKLVSECTFPLTGTRCVHTVITDLGMFVRGADGFVLEEVAAGFTAEEVASLTEMKFVVPKNVKILNDQLETSTASEGRP
jgi:3-oxoacid CoA-transferase